MDLDITEVRRLYLCTKDVPDGESGLWDKQQFRYRKGQVCCFDEDPGYEHFEYCGQLAHPQRKKKDGL